MLLWQACEREEKLRDKLLRERASFRAKSNEYESVCNALSRALEVLRGVAEREACGDLVRTLLPLSVSGGAAGMRARGDFADRGVDRALRGVGTTTSMCGRARAAKSSKCTTKNHTGDGFTRIGSSLSTQ